MEEIIKCENVSLAYGGKTVLEDVSFEVFGGDYICLLGENGTGKSTLIEGILGLHPPVSGKIEYANGLSASDIGYLPQFKTLDRNFPTSVFEVALSGCGNSGRLFYSAEDKNRAAEMLKTVGLYDRRKSCFASLSGGQRQRVLLARALCASKKVILLDEPMASLDRTAAEGIYELLQRLNREGLTVIMVSHDISAAVKSANRVLYINHRLVFCGSRDEYMKSSFFSHGHKEDREDV